MDFLPPFKIDSELPLVTVERDGSAVTEVDSLAICKGERPVLRMINGSSVIVGEPYRLDTIRPYRGAREDQCILGLGKRTIRAVAPCRVVVFVTNDENASGAA